MVVGEDDEQEDLEKVPLCSCCLFFWGKGVGWMYKKKGRSKAARGRGKRNEERNSRTHTSRARFFSCEEKAEEEERCGVGGAFLRREGWGFLEGIKYKEVATNEGEKDGKRKDRAFSFLFFFRRNHQSAQGRRR